MTVTGYNAATFPQAQMIAAYQAQFKTTVTSSITGLQNAAPTVASRRLADEAVVFNMNTNANSKSDADAITKDADAITPTAMTTALSAQITANGGTAPSNLGTAVEQAKETGPPEPPFVDACFPADASTVVQGRGRVTMADLRTNDDVLVQRDGVLAFEPVLAFLHAFKGDVEHVTVLHEKGTFHASPGHLVLTGDGGYTAVGTLRPGDAVYVADADGLKAAVSRVLSAQLTTRSDAYAPLTASGTIVVDGVVASTYASPAKLNLKHSVAHAFLFPVRAYSAIVGLFGAEPAQAAEDVPELHPFLQVMYQRLGVDTLHMKLASGLKSM
jgi:hypothetical protein